MAIKLAWRNKRAGQKISRGLDISPATYRSRVDMKVLTNVGLGFCRAEFSYSRDLGFVTPQCRLARASNSITVIGAQKCYSILLAFDAIARTGIAEYKLASGLAQSWLKPVAAGCPRKAGTTMHIENTRVGRNVRVDPRPQGISRSNPACICFLSLT